MTSRIPASQCMQMGCEAHPHNPITPAAFRSLREHSAATARQLLASIAQFTNHQITAPVLRQPTTAPAFKQSVLSRMCGSQRPEPWCPYGVHNNAKMGENDMEYYRLQKGGNSNKKGGLASVFNHLPSPRGQSVRPMLSR
jgi:hypothetical protein